MSSRHRGFDATGSPFKYSRSDSTGMRRGPVSRAGILIAASVLVLVLAGSASAYHGKPGRAGIVAEGPVRLDGDLVARAQPASVLYLGDGDLRLTLLEGEARATLTEVRTRAGPLALLPPPDPTTSTLEGRSLDLASRGPAANVLVFTHGGLAEFSYAASEGTLARADAGLVAPTRAALDAGLADAQSRGARFAHESGTAEAALFSSGGTLEALGDFSLFAYDATLLLDGEPVRTGSWIDEASGERVVRYVVVDVTDAQMLVHDAGSLSSFRSRLVEVALNGTASFAAARGSAAVDSADPNLAGDVATLTGVMTVAAQPTDRGLRLDAQGDFVAATFGGVASSFLRPAATLGAAAALVAVAVLLWPAVKTSGAAALYARFAGPEVLDHAARDRALALVRASPGANVRDVATGLGISWSTAAYHLEVLSREGFLVRHQTGRHRRYFVVDDQADRDAASLLHDPTAHRLHDLVRDGPGRTQKELAALAGISASTASWQLRRLVAAGVLAEQRSWRRVAYRVVDA